MVDTTKNLNNTTTFYPHPKTGRCIHHPTIRLRKKKLFGRGWKIVIGHCPYCCLDEMKRMAVEMRDGILITMADDSPSSLINSPYDVWRNKRTIQSSSNGGSRRSSVTTEDDEGLSIDDLPFSTSWLQDDSVRSNHADDYYNDNNSENDDDSAASSIHSLHSLEPNKYMNINTPHRPTTATVVKLSSSTTSTQLLAEPKQTRQSPQHRKPLQKYNAPPPQEELNFLVNHIKNHYSLPEEPLATSTAKTPPPTNPKKKKKKHGATTTEYAMVNLRTVEQCILCTEYTR